MEVVIVPALILILILQLVLITIVLLTNKRLKVYSVTTRSSVANLIMESTYFIESSSLTDAKNKANDMYGVEYVTHVSELIIDD